ncbi:hypothetical protein [Vibrio phage VP4B]|uniref:Big-1 domain-containing protein n=1 Tax=Vibrio phage VP4B TaxID=1262540 RepID=V9LZB2_9CAUD|nr:hypothetical protein FDJ61_gp050 [Vibrio phage VP4B]AGB07164.1 hypothetical protein [Vibrio phage VP4B]
MANTNTGVGPRKLTMKRSDGKPDTDIISDANGKWSIDVGSEGKGKVTFQFFSGEEKLGEQEINFVQKTDLLDGFDNLSTKNYSNVKGLVLNDKLAPISDVVLDFSYSVDGAAAVTGKTYPSSNTGLFTFSLPTDEMVGKSKVEVTVTYDGTTATRTFDLVDEYLPANFATLHAPVQVRPDETMTVYGKAFYDYNALPLLGPSRKLFYFDKHPAMMHDVTDALEDNGFFKLEIPATGYFSVINNGGVTQQGINVVKELTPPHLFRVAPRSLMIFDSSWAGSSSEWWGRVFDENGNTPNLINGNVVCADLRMSRQYKSASFNSDGSVENWLSVDEDAKNPYCFVDGRMVLPNMTRYNHSGDMFNLAAGTTNWVRAGKPVVNAFAYTDEVSIPKAGVSVKLSSIENGVRTEIGTAVTDKYGVVKFDVPAREEPTRLEMVAEAGEFELFFVNDWVDPAKFKVATDITLPFIPPIYFDGYIQINFDPIDQNGERFNLDPQITYEGMHMQIRDYPFFRPYLDLGDNQGRYMFSLQSAQDKFPSRTRIAMTCDELSVEKDLVIGSAEGINPLIYAAGAGVAGFPITAGWRILDVNKAPLSGKTVKVWYDKVEGEPAHTLTTDKYGSVLADIPWKPLNYTRTIIIQSEGDEFTQQLMWTKKPTGSEIDLRFSSAQMAGDKWFLDIEVRDKPGNVLYDNDCALYEIFLDNKAGMYLKDEDLLTGRYQNRSGQFSMNWPSDDTKITEWVYFTESGFKEFTFDKDNLTSPQSAPVTALKVQPWSTKRGSNESSSFLEIYASDADGKPVANAEIEVHKTDANGDLYTTVLTNDKGVAHYETTHVKTIGAETLFFQCDGVNTTTTVEWANDPLIGAMFHDIDWTLDVAEGHNGIIVGRVSNYTGAPIPKDNFNISVYDAVTGETLSGIGTRTFDDGRFEISVPGTGVKDYVLGTDEGFYPFRMIWSDIPLVNPADLVLSDTTSKVFVKDEEMLLTGYVVDAEGNRLRLTGVPQVATKASNEGYTNTPLFAPDGYFVSYQYPDALGDVSIDWLVDGTNITTMTFPVVGEVLLETTLMSITEPYYQTPAKLVALVTEVETEKPLEGAYVELKGDSVKGKVGGVTDQDGLVHIETPFPEQDAASLTFTLSYGGYEEEKTITWVSRNVVPAAEFLNLKEKDKCSEGEAYTTRVGLGYNGRPATVDTTLHLYDFGTKTYTELTNAIESKNSVSFTIPVHGTGVHKFALCGSSAYQEFEVEWVDGIYDPVDSVHFSSNGNTAEVGATAVISGYLMQGSTGYLATKEEPLFVRRVTDGHVFEGISKVGGGFEVTVEVDVKGEVYFEVYRRPEAILGEAMLNGIEVGSVTMVPGANQIIPLDEYPYLPVYVRDSDGNPIEGAEVVVTLKGGDGTVLTSDTTDVFGYIDLWPEGRADSGTLTYVMTFGSKQVEHTVTFTDDTSIPYTIYSFAPRRWTNGESFRMAGYILDYDNNPVKDVNLGRVWFGMGDAVDITNAVDEHGRFEIEVPASIHTNDSDGLSLYTTSTYDTNWIYYDDDVMMPHHIEWDTEFPTTLNENETFTMSGKVVDKDGVVVPINNRLSSRTDSNDYGRADVSDGVFSIQLVASKAGNHAFMFYFNNEGYVGRQIVTVS